MCLWKRTRVRLEFLTKRKRVRLMFFVKRKRLRLRFLAIALHGLAKRKPRHNLRGRHNY